MDKIIIKIVNFLRQKNIYAAKVNVNQMIVVGKASTFRNRVSLNTKNKCTANRHLHLQGTRVIGLSSENDTVSTDCVTKLILDQMLHDVEMASTKLVNSN